jgi:hypothetical protein
MIIKRKNIFSKLELVVMAQHHQVASIQDPEEELNNISSVPSNKHLFKRATTPNKGKPIAEMWLSMLLFRVQTNEKGIDLGCSLSSS